MRFHAIHDGYYRYGRFDLELVHASALQLPLPCNRVHFWRLNSALKGP
jgi:hypothetical protein